MWCDVPSSAPHAVN
jgi:hypothetical protein